MKEKNSIEKFNTISIELEKDEKAAVPDGFYENEILEFEQKGHYSIKNEIGKGGTGAVFLATDNFIGRNVAVKELISFSSSRIHHLSAKEIRDRNRFLKEAKITGQLEHPGIAPVYEIGRKSDGKLYYTMRLVKGKTLSQAIHDAVNLNERLRLLTHFRDICNTIAYAHSRNVIHRDIKPANVMIGEFGETVMLDWGLAKVKGEEDEKAEELEEGLKLLKLDIGVTVKGKIMGTPAYMSPEQAKGEISSIDELSDIYSLGAVLFEILSGKPPYYGQNADNILKNIENADTPDIKNFSKEIPSELYAIIQKTFIKERDKRYKTAIELSRDIENYMSGHKVSAYEYSSFDLVKKFIIKNKTISLLVASIITILVITTVLISLSYAESVHKEKIAHYNLALGYEAWARQMILSEDYEKGAVFAASALLNNPYNVFSPLRFRDIKIFKNDFLSEKTLNARSLYYISSLKSSDALVSTLLPMTVPNDIKIFPDGKKGVFAGRDKDITVFDIFTGDTLFKLSGHTDEVYSIDISPDGTKILSGSWDGSVILWDVIKQSQILQYKLNKNEVYRVKFSHNGKFAASGGSDRDVIMFELNSGKIIHSFRAHSKGISDLSFSYDDRHLLSSGYDGAVFLWNTETGEKEKSYLSMSGSAFSFARFTDKENLIISADYSGIISLIDSGTFSTVSTLRIPEAIFSAELISGTENIIVSGTDNILRKINYITGKTEEIYRGHDKLINSIAFITGSDYFLTASRDETIKLWKEYSTKNYQIFSGSKNVFSDISISADNSKIIAADRDGFIFLWNKKSGWKKTVIQAHSKFIETIDFSPDNRFFASGSWDKTVKIWDAETGELLKTIKGNNNAVYTVKFSPDNTNMAFGTWDNMIKIGNWRSGVPFKTIKAHSNSVQSIDFSSDGTTLISASRDGDIIKSNLIDNSSKLIFKSNLKITDISVSSGNDKVAFSSDNGSVVIIDQNGKELKQIISGCPTVNSVNFSSDGKYITASGCFASIFTSEGIPVLSIPLNYIGYAALLSENNKYFYTASGNEILKIPFDKKIWEENPEILIKKAEQKAGKIISGFDLK